VNKVKLLAALAAIWRNLEGIPRLVEETEAERLGEADTTIDRAVTRLKDLAFEIEEEAE